MGTNESNDTVGTDEPYVPQQPRIADRCPTCGAQSLFIGAGGWLTCSVIGCKNPAVGDAIEKLRFAGRGVGGALVPPNDTIEDLFTYHAPEGDQAERYVRIRAAAKALAYILMANCPAGPDRHDAVRYIRQAVHFANASIATKNAADRFVTSEWNEAHPSGDRP